MSSLKKLLKIVIQKLRRFGKLNIHNLCIGVKIQIKKKTSFGTKSWRKKRRK